MEEGQPSGTAIFAAMNRAAHLIMDDEPKILRDVFALPFSNLQNEAELRAALQALLTQIEQKPTPAYAQAFLQSYRGFAVIRHRYTEDELEKALAELDEQEKALG